jgi:hypothetical protein
MTTFLDLWRPQIKTALLFMMGFAIGRLFHQIGVY